MIRAAMTETALRIRVARPDDADTVARFCAALAADEGAAAMPFTAAHFRREGFGPAAAFSTLVAEWNGSPVGYALHTRDYHTDRMERSVYLADLFVEKTARRLGVGRALLAATASAGARWGARCAAWGVLRHNYPARAFYRAVGAEEQGDTRWWWASGARFEALAAEAPPPGLALREAEAKDVPLLARFLEDLFRDMHKTAPAGIAAALERDGFANPRLFVGLLAERDTGAGRKALGYAMFWPSYDTDLAGRTTLLSDLYVVPEARREGVGRALMGGVARWALDHGSSHLFWPVFLSNKSAIAYYARIAEEDADVITCVIDGGAFERLIATAPQVAP